MKKASKRKQKMMYQFGVNNDILVCSKCESRKLHPIIRKCLDCGFSGDMTINILV